MCFHFEGALLGSYAIKPAPTYTTKMYLSERGSMIYESVVDKYDWFGYEDSESE